MHIILVMFNCDTVIIIIIMSGDLEYNLLLPVNLRVNYCNSCSQFLLTILVNKSKETQQKAESQSKIHKYTITVCSPIIYKVKLSQETHIALYT